MNEGVRVNAITCTAWVPKGVAKEDPEKVEITKEQLAKIIKETSEGLVELEEQDGKYTELEVEALEEDMKIAKPENKSETINSIDDVEMEDETEDNKDCTEEIKDKDDFEKRFDFENYDADKDGIESLLKFGRLTVHTDNIEDPYVTVKEDDNESEVENCKIYATDNLITVGHIEDDAAILEVYVYNDVEESLYVHHDILLPSVPLCMEWLNYDPEAENLTPGNMVAIGSMSPIIEVWDLDLIDCLEPAYVLGRKPKKKKKLARVGHSDAVLCLAWNKDLDHILASGSADNSIILWDLQECKESQKMSNFSSRVQDLKWNSFENHYLLAGSSDKTVKLFDCVSKNDCKSWKLDGEVESIVWDPCGNHSFNFFASTDAGSVYSIDARQTKPMQKISAHSKCCTGVVMNKKLPGCLVSVSEDETVRIWDVHHPKAKLVEETNPKLGIIHTVSCAPESPFVLSLGGNNRNHNFKVWDIRQSRNVRSEFFDRLGLPIENDGDNDDNGYVSTLGNEGEEADEDYEDMESHGAASYSNAPAQENAAKWRPPKKSKKKKGGHLDKKKWK